MSQMPSEKILIFAGTTEGRELFKSLSDLGIATDISVATEYGRELIENSSEILTINNNCHVLSGRLSVDEMKTLIVKNNYTIIVDATHPYATEVTQNINFVCNELKLEYIRLLRDSCSCDEVVSCNSIEEAVDYLNKNEGNILSTIGSKELTKLKSIHDYQSRVYARILSLPNALQECIDEGFQGSRLICMQGPFSHELNLAMLKQYDCKFLLTKNSGNAGGFDEKISAAKECGAKVILIERPTSESGLTAQKVIEYIKKKNGIETTFNDAKGIDENSKTHFPLFIDITDKTILVVGAGKIATRRIETLSKFNCKIKVVALDASDEVKKLNESGKITLHQREFKIDDLDEVFLIVTATDNREINHRIGIEAKRRNIHVSVADSREECTFYFPAVIQTSKTVIGITGNGRDHHAVSQTADKIRKGLSLEN